MATTIYVDYENAEKFCQFYDGHCQYDSDYASKYDNDYEYACVYNSETNCDHEYGYVREYEYDHAYECEYGNYRFFLYQ